jgi:hypothetical protein
VGPSPYRASASRDADDPRDALRGDAPRAGDAECELLPVYGLVWIAATVRVAYVLASGEQFSGEPALALCATVAIPWLFRAPMLALLRRIRRRLARSSS